VKHFLKSSDVHYFGDVGEGKERNWIAFKFVINQNSRAQTWIQMVNAVKV